MDLPAVLIVEDDPALLRVFRRLLGSSEYTLVTVSSVAEALVAAQQMGDQLQLALIDRQLADGNGDDLAHELRKRHEHVQVVIVTGDDDGLQGFEVLAKPFNSDKLRALVKAKLAV